METIKEIVNVARRVANAVDSSTASFEPSASATEDQVDLTKIGDFITEADMIGCMGVVENRAQHAIRLLSEALKTPGGKAVATAFMAQTRRDASLRVSTASSVSPPPRVGTTSSFDYLSPSASTTVDLSTMLLQAEKVSTVCILDSVESSQCKMLGVEWSRVDSAAPSLT
jgi:hypothetical protein